VAKIPKILHYCFGFKEDFGGKPWSLVHYACVRSAIERLRPERAYIYLEYEPKGVWWKATRHFLTLQKMNGPTEVFGNPLRHPAHVADVVRLRKLLENGGIYLDADVFVHRSFDDLLDNSVVLGEEGAAGKYGLGNAVILAEPDAPFIKRWYDEYRSFRSEGWSEHSIQKPMELARKFPNEITVLPHDAFYSPDWSPEGVQALFGSRPTQTRGTRANHLWESFAWEKYLEDLTPGRVRNIESNFHIWVRPFVSELADDFGELPLRRRLAKQTRKRVRSLKVTSQRAAKKLIDKVVPHP
jgi:hypothetical protein